ncbi:MAG: amidohydrolase [Acholeplasmatales bacterium]|nr:amidohydrolase [Acholeplasmatales bacterium]
MKKIDCHVHLVENIHGMGSKGYLRDLGNGSGMYLNGEVVKLIPDIYGSRVTPELLIKEMDKNDIEYAICLQGHYLGDQTLYSYEAMKKYPNRFIASCMYDPYYRNKKSIVEYLYDKLEFKVTKMEVSNSSGLMCNHDTIDLSGKLFDEVLDVSYKHNNIFFIDIGRPGNDCYQIDNLVKIIKKYKDMIFVVCHLTAPQKGMIELLKENMTKLKLDNCYFDIASLYNNVKDPYPFIETQNDIKAAINIVGSDKILWGSDFPSALKNTTYEESYKYIEDSDILTKEEKENILYNNANKLFRPLLGK